MLDKNLIVPGSVLSLHVASQCGEAVVLSRVGDRLRTKEISSARRKPREFEGTLGVFNGELTYEHDTIAHFSASFGRRILSIDDPGVVIRARELGLYRE